MPPRLCSNARVMLFSGLFQVLECLTRYGHQTGTAYSRIGRTRVLYRVEKASTFEGPSAL